MPNQTKIFTYKRATFLAGNDKLQARLTAGLKSKKLVFERLKDLGNQETYQALNRTREYKNMFFGQFVQYSKNTHAYLLAANDNAVEFDLEEHAIPHKQDKKSRELLESALYFGVLDNHVVIAQSSALRARNLELYFSWFLQECTNVLNKNNGLALSDHTSSVTRKKITEAHVKSVKIGTPLESKTDIEPSKKISTNVKSIKIVPFGRGFSLLEAYFGEEWIRKLKLTDALDEANIQVRLEVTYLRKTTQNANKLLDNIALSFRHADEDDVTIHLVGGGEIKGNELKISSSESILHNNGLIDEDDIFDKMHKWLSNKIDLGLIDP